MVLASDADLDRFVRSLLARPPAELEAIRAGRLRFTLQAGAPSGVVHRLIDSSPPVSPLT